jgi:hypothetical protein
MAREQRFRIAGMDQADQDSPRGSCDPMEDITSALIFDDLTTPTVHTIFQPHSVSPINSFAPRTLKLPLFPPTLRSPVLSATTIEAGVDTFFTHLTHTCPFIHQPTFDISAAPDVLLLAILCVSQQYIDNSEQGRGVGHAYYTRAKVLLEDMSESECSPMLNLQTVQACLLLQLYAVLLVGGSETKQGLRLHAKCIEVSLGMFCNNRCSVDVVDGQALWSNRTLSDTAGSCERPRRSLETICTSGIS